MEETAESRRDDGEVREAGAPRGIGGEAHIVGPLSHSGVRHLRRAGSASDRRQLALPGSPDEAVAYVARFVVPLTVAKYPRVEAGTAPVKKKSDFSTTIVKQTVRVGR